MATCLCNVCGKVISEAYLKEIDMSNIKPLLGAGCKERIYVCERCLHDISRAKDEAFAKFLKENSFLFKDGHSEDKVKDEKLSMSPAKQLAEMIGRVGYGWNPNKEQREFAKNNDLVIVYGASDDLCEMDGAVWSEVNCFEGGSVSENVDALANAGIQVDAVWDAGPDKDGISWAWSYITNVSHEKFYVYEDGDPYCCGIIFSLS